MTLNVGGETWWSEYGIHAWYKQVLGLDFHENLLLCSGEERLGWKQGLYSDKWRGVKSWGELQNMAVFFIKGFLLPMWCKALEQGKPCFSDREELPHVLDVGDSWEYMKTIF